MAADAHVHPLQPLYEWEQREDSAHEKDKALARLTEELGLGSTELKASAVFAKPFAEVIWPPLVFGASKVVHKLHVILDWKAVIFLSCAIRLTGLQVEHCGVQLSARTDVVIHHAMATLRSSRLHAHKYLQIWELKTTKSLQVLPEPSQCMST